ncbi:hypothetical protein J7K24_02340 [bacterium]|nr:hypothetical protein [bacterium]
MKIERAVIKEDILPDKIKAILDALIKEKNLAIKGGVARTVLLYYMKQGRKRINEKRLEIEKDLSDIDVIVLHSQSLARSKEYLIQREEILREVLSEFISEGIRFDGRDIEPVRGSLLRPEYKQKTLTKILRTRDLTINEVVLIPESNYWTAYFSKRCWRDLLCSIGMLTSGGWKTIRYDAGRMIPTNYGFYRLLKFWVEKKVGRIWLPKWMIEVHLKEIERRNTVEGASLGRYSRVIVNQYRNSSPQIKKRWMRALRYLGFTDLESFEIFAKEQELLDALQNQEEFLFEENVSLFQMIEKTLHERKKKQKDREERKKRMKRCLHKFSVIQCNGCERRCRINKCLYCDYVEKRGEFQCNEIFRTGDWCRDPSSLISFPRSNSLQHQLVQQSVLLL